MLSDRDRYRGFSDADAPYLRWARAAMRDAGLDRHQTEGVISEYLRVAHTVGKMTLTERAEMASKWFLIPGVDSARALDVFKSADKVLRLGIETMQPPTPTPAQDASRAAEIEAIMKEDFRRYYQDRELQSEYTEILERQAGTSTAPANRGSRFHQRALAVPAAPPAAVAAQPPAGADRRQEIERAMYTSGGRPGAYWQDAGMQAEYLALSAPTSEGAADA